MRNVCGSKISVEVDPTLSRMIELRDLGSISPTCLRAASTRTDPQIVQIQPSCQYLFAHLGSARVKTAHKMLVKLTPAINFTNILQYKQLL